MVSVDAACGAAEPEWVGAKDLAAYLGVSAVTVGKWAADPEAGLRDRSGGAAAPGGLRFDVGEVGKWLDASWHGSSPSYSAGDRFISWLSGRSEDDAPGPVAKRSRSTPSAVTIPSTASLVGYARRHRTGSATQAEISALRALGVPAESIHTARSIDELVGLEDAAITGGGVTLVVRDVTGLGKTLPAALERWHRLSVAGVTVSVGDHSGLLRFLATCMTHSKHGHEVSDAGRALVDEGHSRTEVARLAGVTGMGL